MNLNQAHKILIGSAIALFAFYALLSLRKYAAGQPEALTQALLSGGVTVAFAAYLRWFARRP